MSKPSIYTLGGTVQAGEGIYIPRRADKELLGLCKDGTFAYVLSSRQMGKSSLMVHTAERLEDMGVRSAIVDLTEHGTTHLTADQWYQGLLTTIADGLQLTIDIEPWWQAHAQFTVVQRLRRFFHDVLLAEVNGAVVIFIDEIDSTLSLPFSDDFYAAIRSVYNARATNPAFKRLSFVLIGVATPGDLIKDAQRTPFNIGRGVELADFSKEDTLPLAEGLGLPLEHAEAVLGRVLQWTGGHPYLTQRLCHALASREQMGGSEDDVEMLVKRIFLSEQESRDTNIRFVRDMLLERVPPAVGVLDVLATYRAIRLKRRPVHDEEQSLVKAHLKLSGIVRREHGVLRVRNRIYAAVFNARWIKEHWPVHWWKTSPYR